MNDFMEPEVFGPKLRAARKRFGRLTVRAAKRVAAMTLAEVERAALQLPDGGSLEELLGR